MKNFEKYSILVFHQPAGKDLPVDHYAIIVILWAAKGGSHEITEILLSGYQHGPSATWLTQSNIEALCYPAPRGSRFHYVTRQLGVTTARSTTITTTC